MKRYIFFLVLVVFFIHNLAISQIIPGLNYARLHGPGKGMNITFEDPQSRQPVTKFAGQIVGYVNPSIFLPPTISVFYSINLYEDPVFQDTSYIDTDINMDRTINNLLYLYEGILNFPDDSSTAASLQMMIWRQTNQLNIGSITDSIVKARSLLAMDFLGNNWSDCFPEQALKLRSIGIDQVRVEVFLPLCTMYGPIPRISLRITEGVLSDSVINVDDTGISPLVTVSGASNGAIISAYAALLPPGPNSLAGRLIATSEIFRSPHGGPAILINFAQGFPSHKIDWGTLPVELSSFTSTVNMNDVTLNWSTVTELNNSEFQVERKNMGNWETIGYVAGHGSSTMPHAYEYVDRNLQSGKYVYRLLQIDFNGNHEYHNLSNEVVIGIPVKFELKQNYPNPFNPSTTISYTLPVYSNICFRVYDVTGTEVQKSVVNKQPAGYYSIKFDGSNLSSGIYYYQITAGNFVETKKMVLIK